MFERRGLYFRKSYTNSPSFSQVVLEETILFAPGKMLVAVSRRAEPESSCSQYPSSPHLRRFSIYPIFWCPNLVLGPSQLCPQHPSRIIRCHFCRSLLLCGFFCSVPSISQCASAWLLFGWRWDQGPTDESPWVLSCFCLYSLFWQIEPQFIHVYLLLGPKPSCLVLCSVGARPSVAGASKFSH